MRRGDLEVYVLVGDRRLEEYSVVVNPDLRLSSCWIASEEGQEFAVIVRNSNLCEYVVKLFIDGREMDYAVVQRSTAKRLAGTYISATELRAFKFVKLNLTSEDTDDALLLSGSAPVDLESLGKIELQGWRVTSGEKHDWNRNHFDQREIGAVNERSKKAASHVVGLGQKVQVPKTQTVAIKYIDSPDKPGSGLSFRFLYRSSAILQAQGIMRAPSSAVAVYRGPPPLHNAPSLRPTYDSLDYLNPLLMMRPTLVGTSEELSRRWEPNESFKQAEIQKRLETMDAEMEIVFERLREAEAREAGGQVKQETELAQPTLGGPREVIDLTMDSDGE